MSIKRADPGKIGFEDVATGKRLAPVHPGNVLLHDFIEPLGITSSKLAKLAGMQQRRIDEICTGTRAVTAVTALRLGRLFGMEAQTWMNLQTQFDLESTDTQARERNQAEVMPFAQAT